MVGPIDVKRKGQVSVGYWVWYAILTFDLTHEVLTGEFPAQRSVTRSFDVFFDLRQNKRLSKQSWGWWF